MHSKSLFYGSSDHLLFTTRWGDIATKGVVTVREELRSATRTGNVEKPHQLPDRHGRNELPWDRDGTGSPGEVVAGAGRERAVEIIMTCRSSGGREGLLL